MHERDNYAKDDSKPKISRKTKRKVAATKQFLTQYYAELKSYLGRRLLRCVYISSANTFSKICEELFWNAVHFADEALGLRTNFLPSGYGIVRALAYRSFLPEYSQENVKAFLAEQEWPPEDKQAFMQQQYEKESSYLRLRRRRTALNDFAILALLGRGGYGEVYLCRKIDTGEVLALKRMKKARFTEKNDVLRVMKEREVMVKSNSPWLARLKYCFQTETHLYMAMVRLSVAALGVIL